MKQPYHLFNLLDGYPSSWQQMKQQVLLQLRPFARTFSGGMMATLRKQTQAPLSMCQQAAREQPADYAKALQWLNAALLSKGMQAISSERCSQQPAAYKESLLFAKQIAGSGICIIELASQTDFVAKNKLFLELGCSIVNSLGQQTASLEAVNEQAGPLLSVAISKLGESIKVIDHCWLPAAAGTQTFTYLHQPIAAQPGSCDPSIGIASRLSLVVFQEGQLAAGQQSADAAVKLAQHVLALKPSQIEGFLLQQPFIFAEQESVAQFLQRSSINAAPISFYYKERFNAGIAVQH